MKWVKPNGSEIETNDLPATIEVAKKLGWVEAKSKRVKKKANKEVS